MKDMEKKPGLMIAVLEGLKKKGKIDSSLSGKGEESEEGYEDSEAYREQLEQISKDFIEAVKDEDPIAVADLFEEAFECLENQGHYEGPHLGEDEE